MLDWSKLTDAYGPATAVRELLAAMEPDPDAEVWNELISRLCHQGSTFSASYAALPDLLAVIERWPSLARVTPLCLAASILASGDTSQTLFAAYADMRAALRQHASDAITSSTLTHDDLVWLQKAYLLLDGERVWGREWDRLLTGELTGACPSCATDLYLVIGDAACFVTAEDWINDAQVARLPIEPASASAPVPPGNWLLDVAAGQGDALLERQILHAFGASTCPSCNAAFAIGDALHAD